MDGGQVHLWWAVPAVRPGPIAVRDYEVLLAPEEVEQQRRFRNETDRRTFLISRLLLRRTLSRYAEIPPAAWRFRRIGRGRPELEPGLCETDLRFNLSHTRGLIAVAVTIGREIGVDVEGVARTHRHMAVAGRFFSPEEMEALIALPAENRYERFLHYWTLKESYIKARGLGIPAPLSQVSFRISSGQPIEARFDPDLENDPAAWQFELFRPTAEHVMALAVRRGRRSDLEIRMRSADPFLD